MRSLSMTKERNVSSMQRRFRGKDGNLYIQRKGHIFEYVKKKYVDGEIVEYHCWRGVVQINGKARWKESQDRSVIEKWLDNILTIYKRRVVVEYAKRDAPIKMKAKYGGPVRIPGVERE